MAIPSFFDDPNRLKQQTWPRWAQIGQQATAPPFNSASGLIGDARSAMGGSIMGPTWASGAMGTNSQGGYEAFSAAPFQGSFSPIGMGANAGSTRISTKPTIGETGQDAINRQGGLSPQYNMGGVGDFYQQQYAPSSFDRLQNQKTLQQSGPLGYNASQYIGGMQGAAGMNDPAGYGAWQQGLDQLRAYQQFKQQMQQQQTPAANIGWMPSLGPLGQVPFMMPQQPQPNALQWGSGLTRQRHQSWDTTPQQIASGRAAVSNMQAQQAIPPRFSAGPPDIFAGFGGTINGKPAFDYSPAHQNRPRVAY